MGLASKSGIYLDIPTRWNSTFKMLREALKYKAVLNSYAPKYLEAPLLRKNGRRQQQFVSFSKHLKNLILLSQLTGSLHHIGFCHWCFASFMP
jgi:hypothetical protein